MGDIESPMTAPARRSALEHINDNTLTFSSDRPSKKSRKSVSFAQDVTIHLLSGSPEMVDKEQEAAQLEEWAKDVNIAVGGQTIPTDSPRPSLPRCESPGDDSSMQMDTGTQNSGATESGPDFSMGYSKVLNEGFHPRWASDGPGTISGQQQQLPPPLALPELEQDTALQEAAAQAGTASDSAAAASAEKAGLAASSGFDAYEQEDTLAFDFPGLASGDNTGFVTGRVDPAHLELAGPTAVTPAALHGDDVPDTSEDAPPHSSAPSPLAGLGQAEPASNVSPELAVAGDTTMRLLEDDDPAASDVGLPSLQRQRWAPAEDDEGEHTSRLLADESLLSDARLFSTLCGRESAQEAPGTGGTSGTRATQSNFTANLLEHGGTPAAAAANVWASTDTLRVGAYTEDLVQHQGSTMHWLHRCAGIAADLTPTPPQQQQRGKPSRAPVGVDSPGVPMSSAAAADPSTASLLLYRASGTVSGRARDMLTPPGTTAPPGSALQAPPSATRTPLGYGRTSAASAPLASPSSGLTFQEFLGKVEIQFLEPAHRQMPLMLSELANCDIALGSVEECLCWVGLTTVRNAVLRGTVGSLKEACENRRSNLASKQSALVASNPAFFHAVKVASGKDLLQLQRRAQLLQRCCQAQTGRDCAKYLHEREIEHLQQLQTNLQYFEEDCRDMQVSLERIQQLQAAAKSVYKRVTAQFEAESQAAQAAQEQEQQVEKMLAEARHSRRQAASCQQQLISLKSSLAELQILLAEARKNRSEAQALRDKLLASSTDSPPVPPEKVVQLRQRTHDLELLSAITGWKVEQLRSGPSGVLLSASFRSLWRLRAHVPAGPSPRACRLEASLKPPDELQHLTAERRRYAAALLRALAGRPSPSSDADAEKVPDGVLVELSVGCQWSQLTAALTPLQLHMSLASDVLTELDVAPLQHRHLTHIGFPPDGPAGQLRLTFLNAAQHVKFSTDVALPARYPHGQLTCTAHVQSAGRPCPSLSAAASAAGSAPAARLTEQLIQDAVGGVPAQPCRLTAMLQALSMLAG